MRLTRKEPRDFVHFDEFVEADASWESYFFAATVWILVDEYRAELDGDEDYSRILVHAGDDEGWLYSRRLSEKKKVHDTFKKMAVPVSEQQLRTLGFVRWAGEYI